MQIDRFTKACLLAIVVLLTILLVKPVFEARDSYAAKKVQYKVVFLSEPRESGKKHDPQIWEVELQKYGSEGWELVGFAPSNLPYIAVLKR